MPCITPFGMRLGLYWNASPSSSVWLSNLTTHYVNNIQLRIIHFYDKRNTLPIGYWPIGSVYLCFIKNIEYLRVTLISLRLSL